MIYHSHVKMSFTRSVKFSSEATVCTILGDGKITSPFLVNVYIPSASPMSFTKSPVASPSFRPIARFHRDEKPVSLKLNLDLKNSFLYKRRNSEHTGVP